ncbi:MAG TPA: hypothetical protein VHC18_07475 [Amycolatopsis sp.]|nr:hypothetical protein [Amycolatopsis sp.]
MADDVHEHLWNDGIGPEDYTGTGAQYRATILEQYRVYVEMADRISARRALTNTFFLTINTAVFTVVGVLWANRPTGPVWFLVFPLLALLGECAAWFYLVRSYRQLNTAKYAVIGALEAKLPASPYWRAEWHALGEGHDRSRYWPLTHLEQGVPVVFAVIYVVAFVALLLW